MIATAFDAVERLVFCMVIDPGAESGTEIGHCGPFPTYESDDVPYVEGSASYMPDCVSNDVGWAYVKA